MQTLFGNGAGGLRQRGPFPFGELALVVACIAILSFCWARQGLPVGATVFTGAMASLIVAGVYVTKWRHGGFWVARAKPGPFPWRRLRNEVPLALGMIALLVAERAPLSAVGLTAALMVFGGGGMEVGKWLWANRRHAASGPEDQAGR